MIRGGSRINLGLPFWTGCSLSSVLILACFSFAVIQLTGCSAPKRAPVVSREKGVKRAPTTRSVSRQRSRPGSYLVRRGDTLYTIAWRFGLDHKRLAGWNKIRAPYTIYPGQRLRFSPPPKSYSPPPRSKPGTKTTVTKKTAVAKKRPSRAVSTQKPARQPSKFKKSTPTLKLGWSWPTKGRVVEGYRRGDPARKGVKIGGKPGQPVMAAETGKIVYAGSGLIGYGRLIIIKHNKNYLSAYGYNRKVLVKEGDQVKRGERIALMGNNGGGKTMLHFEIRRNGAPVDPLTLLPRNR